jgi:hypothetical protein
MCKRINCANCCLEMEAIFNTKSITRPSNVGLILGFKLHYIKPTQAYWLELVHKDMSETCKPIMYKWFLWNRV